MGKIWCITVSLFCYNALFSKLVSDLGTFCQLCTNKIPIEFALQDEHKHIAIPNLGHLLWSLQSMGKLASIMRKSRTFLITNANSLH